MNAAVEDTGVFAGLNSYRVNKRAAQRRSEIEKALAAPLLGKPCKACNKKSEYNVSNWLLGGRL
jgi:hypothetical protein